MKDWIKNNKAWLVALGAGLSGLATYLGIETPEWAKAIWLALVG